MKQEIITHLRNAKTSHIRWLQKAKMLINGLDIKEEDIPVNATECKFGTWFYNEGQRLNSLPNNTEQLISDIEELHFKLHDIYMQIFNIFFQKRKGLLSFLFGRKKVSDEDYKKAKSLYEEMEIISKELINKIEKLEHRLQSLPSEELEKIF